MLTRFALLAVVGLTLVFGGCENKAARERDDALRQNADLMAQRDADRVARLDMEDRLSAAANAPVVQVAPVVPVVPAMEEPAGGAVDLGAGIQVTQDKSGSPRIHIPGDVLFDSGKATLKPAAKKSLDKVAALIKKDYKGKLLRIEGHTDPTPVKKTAWDDNWDLGAARARAVLLYLIEKGVPKKDMYIASFADNQLKSTKNYALNRRVDIVVTGGR